MNILAYIERIDDPRQDYKVIYPLTTLLFTTLCAILCGCQSWLDVEDYCYAKRKWLSQHIDLSRGIPSSWTFRRLFTLLDPLIMEILLKDVSAFLLSRGKSDHIIIDGKALKGSRRYDIQCLKSVSAWCHEHGLVLAEKAVSQDSHESKTIPLLLEALALKGTTVSIDAAGCTPLIAESIIKKKGHYVLALKKNQPKLYETVTRYMQEHGQDLVHLIKDGFDDTHGRSVRRRYFACNISQLGLDEKWTNLRTAIAVETISGTPRSAITTNWRYYLTSHCISHHDLAGYVRNHWSIENKLHWVLDVQMREDDDLKAERKSAKAFATLRRIALNIVRLKDQTPKRSVRRKMMCAAWNEDNLLKLLT